MYQLHQFWDPMMLQEQPSSNGDTLGVGTHLRDTVTQLTMQSLDWWNWDPSTIGLNGGNG